MSSDPDDLAPDDKQTESSRTLVERYCGDVRGFLGKHMKGRERQGADDLAQEVFERLLKYRSKRPIENPRAYVLRVASNVLKSFRTRNSSKDRIELDGADAEEFLELATNFWSDSARNEAEEQQRIELILSQLSPLHAALLVMCMRDGMSHKEAGRVLGIPVNTIKFHVANAKALFKVFASRY